MQNFSFNQTQIRKLKPISINSLIALGNPIVDISAEIEKEDILKFNLRFGGINYVTDENREFYTKIEEKTQVFSTTGGSAQNILRAINWGFKLSNLNDLGAKKLSMLGSVGNDLYKLKIINCLSQSNIHTNLLETILDMKTSRCAIGTCEGNRYFLSEILASRNLSGNFVLNNWDEIKSHDALLIEGYFIRENFELCRQICELFSKEGKYIILTLSDPFTIQNYRNQIITIANMADMVVGNRISALNLIGEEEHQQIDELFRKIYLNLNNKDRIIIVTVGDNGVFCSKYDSTTRNHKYFQTYPAHIRREEIKDLNGAGDAFLGGFLSQQMQDKTFEECCHMGNIVAADVIKTVGFNFLNKNFKN